MKIRTWAITTVGAAGLAIGMAGPAMASTHTVQAGDTLSGIAAQSGVSLSSLEAANPQISNPNMIYAGQQLNVPDGNSAVSSPASSTSPASSSSPGTAPVAQVGGGSAPASFQQCVAWRESSNNPTASSGGLYGILPSTWASLGYSGTAGQASVAQQTQAFQQLYAMYGTSPWAPYDGC